MTYADALDWCIKNLPMNEYDNFNEWYKACEEKLATPNLFESAEFNDSMEDAWLDAFGSHDKEPIPEPESKGIRVVGQKELPKEEVLEKRELPKPEPKPQEPDRLQPEIILPPMKKKGILARIASIFRRKK